MLTASEPTSQGRLDAGLIEDALELSQFTAVDADGERPHIILAGPASGTGRHFLDRIEQAGRNMERLLHDMLELSRIEETPHCAVHVNPIPVLDQLAAELKIRLDEAGIDLHLPVEAPIVVCDRTRLYPLFSNLIGNAVCHMEPNSSGKASARKSRWSA